MDYSSTSILFVGVFYGCIIICTATGVLTPIVATYAGYSLTLAKSQAISQVVSSACVM